MKYENDSFNARSLPLSVWGRLGELWLEPNLHMSLWFEEHGVLSHSTAAASNDTRKI